MSRIAPILVSTKEILKLIDKKFLNACANITGGGLKDNIERIIPKNLCAEIDLNKVKTLKIFKWIKSCGVREDEMIKAFNCGVGFCLVIKSKNYTKVTKYFSRQYKPYIIGKISKNSRRVRLSGKINW